MTLKLAHRTCVFPMPLSQTESTGMFRLFASPENRLKTELYAVVFVHGSATIYIVWARSLSFGLCSVRTKKVRKRSQRLANCSSVQLDSDKSLQHCSDRLSILCESTTNGVMIESDVACVLFYIVSSAHHWRSIRVNMFFTQSSELGWR